MLPTTNVRIASSTETILQSTAESDIVVLHNHRAQQDTTNAHVWSPLSLVALPRLHLSNKFDGNCNLCVTLLSKVQQVTADSNC